MPLDPATFTSTCTTLATRASVAAADAATLVPHLPALRKAQRVLLRNIGDLSRLSSYATTAPALLPSHSKLIEPIVDEIPRRLEQALRAVAVMGKQFLRATSQVGVASGRVKLDEQVLVGYEEYLQAGFTMMSSYKKALQMHKLFSNALEIGHLVKAIEDYDKAYQRVMKQDDILGLAGLAKSETSMSASQTNSTSYPPEKQGHDLQSNATSSGTQSHPSSQAPAELATTNPLSQFELPASTPTRPVQLPGAPAPPAPPVPPAPPALPAPPACPAPPATPAAPSAPAASKGHKSMFSGLSSKFKALSTSMQPKPPTFLNAICAAATANDASQVHSILTLATTPTPENPHPAVLNLNALSESGETPLTAACAASSLTIASLLLKHGADPKTVNAQGVPPLYINDAPEFTQLLLKHGADPNARSTRNAESFFAGVVTKAATTEYTGRTNESGADELTTLRLLLKHGADPATVDISGRNVLCTAVRAGSPTVVQMLMHHGAKASVGDATGLPIVAAMLLPDAPTAVLIAEMLVANGASVGPEARCIRTGQAILQLCVERQDGGDGGRGTARLLGVVLGAGAEVEGGNRDMKGEKIWWNVVQSCEGGGWERGLRLARVYLQKGGLNMHEKHGVGGLEQRTALEFAMERGLWGLVALLVKAGAIASGREKSKDGIALGEAVRMGEEVLALLDRDDGNQREKQQVHSPMPDQSDASSSVADGFRGQTRSVEAVSPPPGPPPGHHAASDEPEDAPPPYESVSSR